VVENKEGQAMSQEERKKRAKRTADRFKTLYIIGLVGIMLIFGFGMIIVGILNEISMMQVDTLNTVQMVNQEEKIDVSEDLTPLTPEERELVQRVVSAEARGEDLQAQMAVVQTILDRSELWGMTVTEVVTAEGQFAKPYQGEISDSVKLAVANVFDGGVRVFDEATTHFHDDSIPPPDWTENKVNRGSIGRLSFWY
jgi:hypothetical protein